MNTSSSDRHHADAILVATVEDDAAIRQMTVECIASDAGMRCVGAFAGVMDALAGIPPVNPDVVLMDINLGAESGISCMRALKARVPDTEFIMLTVYDDSTRVFEALQAGASGYLLKRARCGEILAAIHQVHAGGSPMTGDIARKVISWFRERPASGQSTESLTEREHDVLKLLAEGYAYKEIAAALNVSRGTVNTHVRNIYSKLHVQCRAQATAKLAPGYHLWRTE